MYLTFDQSELTNLAADKILTRITDAEIVELASSFRRFGTFSLKMETGHLYLSPESCEIFSLEPTFDPVPMSSISARIRPQDFSGLLETIEEGIRLNCDWFYNFRLEGEKDLFSFVRMVARNRAGEEGDEFVGILYEFLPRKTIVEWFAPDADDLVYTIKY